MNTLLKAKQQADKKQKKKKEANAKFSYQEEMLRSQHQQLFRIEEVEKRNRNFHSSSEGPKKKGFTGTRT